MTGQLTGCTAPLGHIKLGGTEWELVQRGCMWVGPVQCAVPRRYATMRAGKLQCHLTC